jgi:hypothetical protein
MEKQPVHIDYDLLVDLNACEPSKGKASSVHTLHISIVKRTTLFDAVLTVVLDWRDDRIRQLSATIGTDTALLGYDEIIGIWDRADFPRRAP